MDISSLDTGPVVGRVSAIAPDVATTLAEADGVSAVLE